MTIYTDAIASIQKAFPKTLHNMLTILMRYSTMILTVAEFIKPPDH